MKAVQFSPILLRDVMCKRDNLYQLTDEVNLCNAYVTTLITEDQKGKPFNKEVVAGAIKSRRFQMNVRLKYFLCCKYRYNASDQSSSYQTDSTTKKTYKF